MKVAETPNGPVLLYGDGVHDDTRAVQLLADEGMLDRLPPGQFRITRTINCCPVEDRS